MPVPRENFPYSFKRRLRALASLASSPPGLCPNRRPVRSPQKGSEENNLFRLFGAYRCGKLYLVGGGDHRWHWPLRRRDAPSISPRQLMMLAIHRSRPGLRWPRCVSSLR